MESKMWTAHANEYEIVDRENNPKKTTYIRFFGFFHTSFVRTFCLFAFFFISANYFSYHMNLLYLLLEKRLHNSISHPNLSHCILLYIVYSHLLLLVFVSHLICCYSSSFLLLLFLDISFTSLNSTSQSPYSHPLSLSLCVFSSLFLSLFSPS